ncbi:mediator of DNA damage checkpoint protein 1 isoform X1 [Drosophila kikkawai]|uniref:PAX-interacting protein 1 n=1 Tax=Drosophila kikkawai TaxID=30033 RepID=A0A6P4IKQ2_DROKI|nr:mediator of DNA damage checkpoint protein 1 isoform X1 [Drosophila kikkawai]
MADVCVLCVDGLPAIPLKPNEIYRIGKQKGLEICIAGESMELAHGIVSLLRSGIVRIASVAGRIFVNEEEKQISDIRKQDARDGKVRLRFGNVEASLRFNEAHEAAQDSSGFGECLKDRSIDTTDDSLCIPETQPPPANASVNTTADSFCIPETQAIVFERPAGSKGKVSLGDDFVIPETEREPEPSDLHHETTTCGSDDTESSGMGSQIRICTQDFNEFDEDAIDDFDSSIMLGDALMAVGPPKVTKEIPEKLEKKQDNPLDATDLEMSALNWSATNSKCSLLNSTKADRAATCITPELSAPLADAIRDISTPDIFELMEAHEKEETAQRSNATTPQLCGIKQLVVATIETPRTTQNEEEDGENQDINQDFVATQAFPTGVSKSKESPEKPNQDLIATQVFPSKGNSSEVRQDAEIDQDFVGTQAFPSRLSLRKEPPEKPNEDFIATQVFPSKDKSLRSDNFKVPLNQDFVATQAFPSRITQSTETPKKVDQDFAFPKPNESTNQDFIATQVFPSKTPTPARAVQDSIETQPFHINKENIPQDTDSWSDEIEEILKEMTSGNVVSSPPSSPNEEALKYVKPCVIKDKDHNNKVFLFENVFPNADNKNRWKNELLVEEKKHLKRTASTDSQPAFVTPIKRNRRLSEQSERLDDDCASVSYSRKRPSSLQEKDKSEPPNKSLCKITAISEKAELSTEDEEAAPKKAVTRRPTRKAKTKSRSPTPTVETNQVKKVTRTRSKQAKSQEYKPKETPPKVNKTMQQTKGSEPEETSTKPSEEIMSKQKAALAKPTEEEAAYQAASKREIKKAVESAKKNPKEVKEKADEAATKKVAEKLVESAKKNPEEAEQSTSKRGRKKTVKDLEEPKDLPKRRPGRPRKGSISLAEDSISKTAKPERNTRQAAVTDKSLADLKANKEKTVLEEPVNLKKLVVRLKRSISKEEPSTSTSEKKAEEKASNNPSNTSQANQQDPLKAINKYVKQAKSNGKIKIAFTVCDRLALISVINALKHVVEVTEDPQQCDVLIMDRGERTFKFLTAIASNKPIFSSKWLVSIKSTKSITVKEDHLFSDSNFQEMFKFDPFSVLQHPCLLKGFNFMLCRGIQPNVDEMKIIIQSAGGRVYSQPPTLACIEDLYVVTTSKNKDVKLRNYENVHYIKSEGVMASLVQHKVELLKEHKAKV